MFTALVNVGVRRVCVKGVRRKWCFALCLCRKLESFRFNNFMAVVRDSCDFSIFKSPVFVSLCIHSIVLYLSYDIPYVYIPDMATNAGIPDHSASFLISIIGISSTIGQVRRVDVVSHMLYFE